MENKKLELVVKGEITLPTRNFEEIKEKIRNTDIMLIGEDVAEIFGVQEQLAMEKKAFLEKVDEVLAQAKEYEKMLTEYIDGELKPMMLEYAENSKKVITKEKMDKDGNIYTVEEVKHELPKGFVYKKSPSTFEYNEELIPDKYFKIERKLDKVKVKKAYKDGESFLPGSVIEKDGGATIAISKDKLNG